MPPLTGNYNFPLKIIMPPLTGNDTCNYRHIAFTTETADKDIYTGTTTYYSHDKALITVITDKDVYREQKYN